MPNRPLKIGVTGGIGSGKTVICKIFNLLGVPIYEADLRAKELMVENQDLVDLIKKQFGERAYYKNGDINRTFLAKSAFKNKEKLSYLNSLVHPAVALDFDLWTQKYKNNPYIIKEAALLVESGSYTTLDYLITISAPKDLRIRRVIDRDYHRTIQDVKDIMSKQLNEEEKIKKSKFVIVNDDRVLLIPQVLKIHETLIVAHRLDKLG